MLTERAPGSSVTWTLEMLTDRIDGLPLKGWRVHADLRAGHEGYTSQSDHGVRARSGDAGGIEYAISAWLTFG